MSFLKEARKKLRKELPGITGNKEGAIKQAAMDALVNFAGQDEEFAQAIVQGGKFSDCMKEVCKGIGTSISDLEVYSRAAAFYFPGCKVRFEMHLDLVGDVAGEAGNASSAAAAADKLGMSRRASGSSPQGGAKEPEKKGGLVFDLKDFL